MRMLSLKEEPAELSEDEKLELDLYKQLEPIE